jgi:hypothetical protein
LEFTLREFVFDLVMQSLQRVAEISLSSVNLSATNRDSPLIDRSSIPCLDAAKLGSPD